MRPDADNQHTATAYLAPLRTLDAVRIEDKRNHQASDRQPSTADTLALWRTSPEIPVKS